jgi:putative ABC transport system permease protein
LTTVLTLAIGIGATTAIFSVVNGILIKPLPFPESDRLIALVHQAPGVNQSEMAASPAIYFTYRENNQTFESVALWYSNTASVTGGGDPGEVQRLQSTHELLPSLRVKPLLGRTFSEADDRHGSPGTVILSYGYWQRRFGGAAAVLGETLVVDGAPHEIIGVLPARAPRSVADQGRASGRRADRGRPRRARRTPARSRHRALAHHDRARRPIADQT